MILFVGQGDADGEERDERVAEHHGGRLKWRCAQDCKEVGHTHRHLKTLWRLDFFPISLFLILILHFDIFYIFLIEPEMVPITNHHQTDKTSKIALEFKTTQLLKAT